MAKSCAFKLEKDKSKIQLKKEIIFIRLLLRLKFIKFTEQESNQAILT